MTSVSFGQDFISIRVMYLIVSCRKTAIYLPFFLIFVPYILKKLYPLVVLKIITILLSKQRMSCFAEEKLVALTASNVLKVWKLKASYEKRVRLRFFNYTNMND